MINVLELIDGGFIGGGQTHILSLVKCLDKNIFKPVIAASPVGEFKNLVDKNGYDFCDIELPKLYRTKYLKNLDTIVRNNSIDIIHSHGGVAGMYARFYKKKFNNVKVIHTIHGIHYINSPNVIRKIFSQSVEQFLVPYTDRFICVSDADFELALKNRIVKKDKTVVIKNGIDTNRFKGKEKDKDLLDRYSLNQNDFIIGNISRFDFQKNQKYLINNSREILSNFPDVKILFAGDGKYLNECKALAAATGHSERFIFTGEVSNSEDYYPLFDIFIFPSLWEGLSISLIEAMASSKCILASDIPANKELIRDGSNGFVFDLHKKNEFKEILESLISDDNLRNNLAAQAKIDSENYSEKAMTEKTEEEYYKLTERRHASFIEN